MKKTALLLILTTLLFSRCVKESEPMADFDASQTLVRTGEVISFSNYSKYATDYEWDFGDGYLSNDPEPTHYYSHPGIYAVKLSAYKGDVVSYYSKTIEVAQLSIKVLEYTQKYPVEGASIILYATLYDWTHQINKVAEIYTDNNGVALIGELAPGYYYLDVWQKYHDNYALAKEDLNFIETPYVNNSTTAYFTAWVDYTTSHSQRATASPTKISIQSSTHRVYSKDLQ